MRLEHLFQVLLSRLILRRGVSDVRAMPLGGRDECIVAASAITAFAEHALLGGESEKGSIRIRYIQCKAIVELCVGKRATSDSHKSVYVTLGASLVIRQ